MAEEKKDVEESNRKKPKQQIKATTGAWWRSTVVTNQETESTVAETETVPPTLPAENKEVTPPRKSRPQRGRGKSAGSTQGEVKATRPARKKKTSSAGEKKQGQRSLSSVPEETASPPIAAVEVPESVPADQAKTEQTSEVTSSPDSTSDDTAKGRRGRGRRGGRKKSGQQKTHVEQSEQVENEQEDSEPESSDKPGLKSGVNENDSASGDSSCKPVVKLLINAEEPEECRLALLENGRLESIHVSTVSRVQTRNNIYKAKIVAIEPNLQAAFVDYGTEKNGFLPFNEIHPEYYKQQLSNEVRKLVDTHQWKKLSISDVLERGQEILVQVVKEEVGRKGANMTTYLSLPGRCVVLMPGSDSEGVSRRISGEERRNQLREIMNSLRIPEGIGWIARTASNDITKTALSKDVTFLLKLWREIKAKGQHMDGVGLLYQDYNCVMRFLREYYDPCIQEILVDDQATLEKVRDFVDMLPAKQRTVKVKLHRGARPIFNQYSVEDQIESIYQPQVNLPSGGSIVIDPTEALVAIDVNSGSTSKGKNFEETIFHANKEAATELARQLRLRDLGGLIVVDFIDMRSSKNIREVEKQVKTAMKRDKAKVDISRISRFGLMQISRQKLGSPIESGNYRICEHCRGRGTVRSVETLALFYFRRIHTGASRRQVTRIDCRFPLDVAQYLLNNKRQELIDLEEKYQTMVVVSADPSLKPAEHEILFQKEEKEESVKKTALS